MAGWCEQPSLLLRFRASMCCSEASSSSRPNVVRNEEEDGLPGVVCVGAADDVPEPLKAAEATTRDSPSSSVVGARAASVLSATIGTAVSRACASDAAASANARSAAERFPSSPGAGDDAQTPPANTPQDEEEKEVDETSRKHETPRNHIAFVGLSEATEGSFDEAQPSSDLKERKELRPKVEEAAPTGTQQKRRAQQSVIQHDLADVLPSSALQINIDHPGDIKTFYSMGRSLGEGSFGAVTEASVKATGAKRAIKVISTSRWKKKFHILRQEIKIGKIVDHPNIIKMYEVFEDSKNVYLVLELCLGGELSGHINRHGMSELDGAIVMMQILRGVTYMHKHQICHRDLKAANVLVTDKKSDIAKGRQTTKNKMSAMPHLWTNGHSLREASPLENRLRISDLGLACHFEKSKALTSMVGTPTHMGPEVLQKSYNEACDLWSCGVMLYHLLSGSLPFDGDDEDEIKAKVSKGKYSFCEAWISRTEDALDMLRRLLTMDPGIRPTAQNALLHRWMKKHMPEQKYSEFKTDIIRSLRGYRRLNKFKKASLSVIASMLPEAQISPGRDAFIFLDSDGDGFVSVGELRETLVALKTKHDIDEAVVDIFSELRKEESPSRSSVLNRLSLLRKRRSFEDDCRMADFTYTEFLAATFDRTKCVNDSICRAAFATLDKDSDGKLSKEEMLNGRLLGKLEPEEIEQLLIEFDADGDGEVDFEEFMEVMASGEGWAKCFRSSSRLP